MKYSHYALALLIALPALLGTACNSIPAAATALNGGGGTAASALLSGGSAVLGGAAPAATPSASNVPESNQPGDANMSCEQIKAEIDQMNEILGVAKGEIRSAEALGLTKDLALQGALYGGAMSAGGSSLPYLGTAMNVMNQANAKKKADSEARITAAYNRRAVLTGMYAVKGCGS